ncbi:MAG: winged helix-turn-helix transcriptional regulator, partial [Thermoplasmatota archaeon]
PQDDASEQYDDDDDTVPINDRDGDGANDGSTVGDDDTNNYYDDDDDAVSPSEGEKRSDGGPIIDFFDGDDDTAENASSILIILVLFIVIPVVIGLIIFGYSRIRREDLLNQENRKKIYDHIMNNPGEHFRGLQRAVDLEVGVLSHHLNVLEKEQLIVSEQDGNNRCFWAAGVKHDTDKVRLSRIQENILKEIHSEPGITQSQIAKKMGISRKVVFYHVKFLRNSGVVREEKDKKHSHYYERE